MATKAAPQPELEALLPKESELAQKMREADWSRTDLGPPETWGENLRAAVRLSLTSRFPLALFWGPHFTLLYNEAYVPFLGTAEQLRYLGQPASLCWGESWETTSAILARVRLTAAENLVEDRLFFVARQLPREEVHVRFSYSPLLADDGRTVEGILALGTEITDQVVGARRLETLRKLSVKTLKAQAVQEVCTQVAQVLAASPTDIPFAALYVVDATGRNARLAATVRLAEGHRLPSIISAGDGDATAWPLAAVLSTRHKKEVVDLGALGPDLPTRAMVLPLPATPFTLAGLLVVGVSLQRVWDAAYQAFFDQMAGHLGTTLASAQALTLERKRLLKLKRDRGKIDFFCNVSPELLPSPRVPFRPPTMRGDSGKFDRVATIGNKVTTPGQADERFAGSASEERAKNRAKDEFLAKLGHELRNSLAPVLAALQLSRLHQAPSPELAIIERQVGNLTRQVDDLLDVSRITDNKIELRKQQVELAAVVAQAVEISSPLLHQLGQKLELRVAPQGLVLDVDPSRIAQCLANLLNNAAKYSVAGSPITLSAERVGDKVRVQVRDQGLGIAADMRDRIFDLFVQQEQTLDRSRGGLGVGLAIVRSLVQAHGGTVAVHSEGLGRGAAFTIELPAAHCLAVGPAREEAPQLVRRPAHHLGQRILIVDDNEDTTAMMELSLAELGYTVEVAHDGPEALRRAVWFTPDVALLDLGLPGMSGYELASQLLEMKAAKGRLQLVAVTGYGQEADRQRSRAAGFARHLVKPVDLNMLEQILSGFRS